MPPKFEIRIITDRDCELSTLIQDYPTIIGYFIDSDCENGASNSYAKVVQGGAYYLCDQHLSQLIRSGLTDYQWKNAVYEQHDPSASWNKPK
jgi:hypothetical protein